jgi:F-type H+-transporting ATPase subunit b
MEPFFSSLGIVATMAGAAPAGGNTLARVAAEFHVEWPMVIAQAFNFIVVAFILHRFAFKPLIHAMEARKRKIAEGLQYAEEMRVRLAEVEADRMRTLKEASKRAGEILESARQSAKDLEEAERKRMARDLENLRDQEQKRMDKEYLATLSRARRILKNEAATLAEQILAQELGTAPSKRTKIDKNAAKSIEAIG